MRLMYITNLIVN